MKCFQLIRQVNPKKLPTLLIRNYFRRFLYVFDYLYLVAECWPYKPENHGTDFLQKFFFDSRKPSIDRGFLGGDLQQTQCQVRSHHIYYTNFPKFDPILLVQYQSDSQ